MAGETKMIIITSNDDLIRQFCLNKPTNTQIIDLDNNNQVSSISKDNNNIINLAFLAELSELNSNRDQVYKRVLESPHQGRPKGVKVPKKSQNLICTICGDHAIGYNYDVLSCGSCKAFFRRNANQLLEKLRCLTGQGQCSVNHGARRKCQRCRLERCFAMGMRKDFIHSEEQKQQRRKHLEDNRNQSSKRLSSSESTYSSTSSYPVSTSESVSESYDDIDHLLMDIGQIDDNVLFHDNFEIDDISWETLSIEDWLTTQRIQSSFLSIFQDNTAKCFNLDVSDHTSAVVSWAQFADRIADDFINFFRQIDEFESLNGNDRFILIKYNLLTLFTLRKCFNFNPTNDVCSRTQCEAAQKHGRFFRLCGDSNNIREAFIKLVHSLVKVTEQDPTLISLLLVILIFSKGLSMSEDEPLLNDSLAVYQAQSYYIKLLWNYMVNKNGEIKACQQFTQILTEIFRLQTAADQSRKFFRAQIASSDTMDKLTPLMQTVLHIS